MSFAQSAFVLFAAVGAVGVACAGLAYNAVGMIGVVGAAWAAAISLFVAVVVLFIIRLWGSTPGAVMSGTILRLVLVSSLAWLVFELSGNLDRRSYLMSLGATYLAALAAETWLLVRVKPAVLSLLFKSRMEARG